MQPRSLTRLASITALVVVLGACGGSSGDGPAQPTAIVSVEAAPSASDANAKPLSTKALALSASMAAQPGAPLQIHFDVAAFRKTPFFATLVTNARGMFKDRSADILEPCGLPLLDSATEIYASGERAESFLVGFASTIPDEQIIACLKKNVKNTEERDVRGVPVFSIGSRAAAFGHGVVLFGPAEDVDRALTSPSTPPNPEIAFEAGDVFKATAHTESKVRAGSTRFHADEKKILFEAHGDLGSEDDAKELEKRLGTMRDEVAKSLTKGGKKPDRPLGFVVTRDGKHLDLSLGVDGGGDAQKAFIADVDTAFTAAIELYLRRAKEGEAKNTIGAIARGVQSAYERENAASLNGKAPVHQFPPSGKRIPATVPKGTTYTSKSSEWEAPGWKDIHFMISDPQHYQYEFETAKDGKSVVIRAHGDLDGNGKESLFELTVSLDAKQFTKVSDLKTKDEDE